MVPPSSSGGRLILCIYMYVQPASFATKTNIVNKMSRKYARLCGGRPTLCLPIHSLSLRSKHTSRRCSGSIKTDHNSTEFLNNISSSKDDFSADSLKRGSSEVGNKIMVVVDPSLEAKGALEWALSHTVQTQDTIVLVHVAKPSKQGQKLTLILSSWSFINYNYLVACSNINIYEPNMVK